MNGIFISTLTTLAFLKTMQLLKVFEHFSPVIALIEEVFKYVGPFLRFYIMVNIMFALILRALGVDYSEDYLGMHKIFAYSLLSYRNSIGDLNPPESEFWNTQSENGNHHISVLMRIIFWLTWFI